MNRTRAFGVVIAAVVVSALWAGVEAQQEMRSRPGPGSGIMEVSVVNHPAVTAAQSGEWRVSLADTADVRITNTPSVVLDSPSFLTRGSSYRVTWENEQTETVKVVFVRPNGWVQVENSGARSRWINLNNARAVEEAR